MIILEGKVVLFVGIDGTFFVFGDRIRGLLCWSTLLFLMVDLYVVGNFVLKECTICSIRLGEECIDGFSILCCGVEGKKRCIKVGVLLPKLLTVLVIQYYGEESHYVLFVDCC